MRDKVPLTIVFSACIIVVSIVSLPSLVVTSAETVTGVCARLVLFNVVAVITPVEESILQVEGAVVLKE